jgi:hypothetical protein
MHYRSISLFVGLCLLVCAAGLAAQATQSRLMGTVLDESSGALPGVTVTIQPRSGAAIVVFSDDSGRYLTPWLAPGIYTVSFALSGFETRSVANLSIGDGQTIVLDQKLALASLTERVEVTAPAPKPPESSKPMRPRTVPIEKEILASVCGPREAPAFSLSVGRILPGDDHGRELFAPGDVLNIDAGEQQGISVGQNLVIKRRFQTDLSMPKKTAIVGEQAAGLAQIVETRASASTAMLVYVCGEVFAGDSVERYAPQPAFFAVTDGAPQFDDPAKITIGEHGQMASSGGQLIVIDRGIMKGVQRGQRLTIFRRRADAPPVTIGDGLVIAIRADSATVRIERSTDAVMIGDLVALHR